MGLQRKTPLRRSRLQRKKRIKAKRKSAKERDAYIARVYGSRGGKHRDSEGVVTWMAPRTNEYCEHFQKATVKLDSGEKVLVVPRWMEAA